MTAMTTCTAVLDNAQIVDDRDAIDAADIDAAGIDITCTHPAGHAGRHQGHDALRGRWQW